MGAELRTLLVEDNEPDATYIEELYQEVNWPKIEPSTPPEPHLDFVETLTQCTERLQDNDYEVVLLDLNLPDSSGIETVDTVLSATTDEAVIVLTGMIDEQLGVEAIERGAQDYLIKDDVNATLLGRTIRYALERQHRERKLEQRNEELTLLNRLVRHDIRDDMALIHGWGYELQRHVDESDAQYLDRILEASQHVLDRTDTIGEFLDTLHDHQEASLRPFNVAQTLENEVTKARAVHTEATIEIDGELPEDVFVGGTELLSSIFRNLLANAVQHNDSSNPTVTVGIEVEEKKVTVSVADDGPGIPEYKIDSVFGRTDAGLGDPESGVGLYLVDTLVDMYDGSIDVRNSEPQGCCFEVQLQRFD